MTKPVLYPTKQLVVVILYTKYKLSYIVLEITLTKNVERKKQRHIQGRINRRKPVLSSTMQYVIVSLHTKCSIIQTLTCACLIDAGILQSYY